MNKVEQIFKGKALIRSGIKLYSKQDTLDFIKECDKYEIGLLGIDGFFISNIKTQPSLNDSIDFSDTANSHLNKAYDEAMGFIKSRKDILYFEIVCIDDK